MTSKNYHTCSPPTIFVEILLFHQFLWHCWQSMISFYAIFRSVPDMISHIIYNVGMHPSLGSFEDCSDHLQKVCVCVQLECSGLMLTVNLSLYQYYFHVVQFAILHYNCKDLHHFTMISLMTRSHIGHPISNLYFHDHHA